MIRISIDLVPKGDEDRAFIIAQGVIVNDGKGDLKTGTYDYGLSAQGHKPGDEPGITRSGHLEGFPRQSADVWELLRRILNQGNQGLFKQDGTGEQEPAA